MESGVDFVAADMPEANKLTVHIMAAMAEYEREQISDRTKKALAAAKAKGKKLGWSMPSRQREQLKASRKGVKSNIAHANLFAENTLPIIREIQAVGITTLKGIAEVLNTRGVQTARGKKWFRPPSKTYWPGRHARQTPGQMRPNGAAYPCRSIARYTTVLLTTLGYVCPLYPRKQTFRWWSRNVR